MTELRANPSLPEELPPAPAATSAAATDSATEQAGAAAPRKASKQVWQGIVVLLLLAFVLLLGARLIQTNQSEQRASGQAPDFAFTTFDGQQIKLSDLRGKGVVLNFWASWCDPCREEAALLEQTSQREKDNGIVFLGLDYLDQEPQAKEYLKEFGITYPNGPDLQSAAARKYGIKGVPETFTIDPEGKIVDIIIGPVVSQGKMDEYLQKIRPAK